jgi:hypothetical protein
MIIIEIIAEIDTRKAADMEVEEAATMEVAEEVAAASDRSPMNLLTLRSSEICQTESCKEMST